MVLPYAIVRVVLMVLLNVVARKMAGVCDATLTSTSTKNKEASLQLWLNVVDEEFCNA